MSLILTLQDATGALFANASQKANAPKLEGFVNFVIGEKKEGKEAPTLRLDVSAWTKEKDGKPYYSLSFGGMNGAMFPETEKRSESSPDYTGTLGPNRDLRVAGWKKTSESGEKYISLLISEPSNTRQQAPSAKAGKEAAFI